jgi:hypothetical protein
MFIHGKRGLFVNGILILVIAAQQTAEAKVPAKKGSGDSVLRPSRRFH